MKNNKNNVSQWFIGNITDDEFKETISSEDYNSFIRLREVLKNFKSNEPDLNLVYNQIISKKNDISALRLNNSNSLYKMFSVAASIILFLSIGFYHFGIIGNRKYATHSTIKNLALNDNVSVKLFNNSIITQNAPLYNTSKINLIKGKAYFEVVKGNNFSIETKLGEISVLGTKFSVEIKNEYLDVICYEGKVSVLSQGKLYYLEQGKRFNSKINDVMPFGFEKKSISNNETARYKNFNSVNVNDLITFLERNYKVSIVYPVELSNNKISGTFPLDNIEASVKLISTALKLNYEISEDKIYFKK